MTDHQLMFEAMTHVVSATLRKAVPKSLLTDVADRDRGAVSIEQVLWYAAAAVSVAAVSKIVWDQIKSTAGTSVSVPAAP